MGATELEKKLKVDLRQAMRSRDRAVISALRSAISAIDNAGSVGLDVDSQESSIGRSNDVGRRELTEEEAKEIVRREVTELDAGIVAARGHGSENRAAQLEAQRNVLARYVESYRT